MNDFLKRNAETARNFVSKTYNLQYFGKKRRIIFVKNILFVCHGNICRSPMAEFIFKNMLAQRGLSASFTVASAATSTEEIYNGRGNPVYPPAVRELAKHGISCEGHAARQVTMKDYHHFDRIYYMDARNLRYLRQQFPNERKFQPFLPRDVADPWYTGDFTQTWNDVVEGCTKIMEEFA